MDKIKGYIDFIKSFGAAFTLVIGGIIWVGKPYADEYIKDTVKNEIQGIKNDQKKTLDALTEQQEIINKLTTVLVMSMSDKEKKALKTFKSDKELLIGK